MYPTCYYVICLPGRLSYTISLGLRIKKLAQIKYLNEKLPNMYHYIILLRKLNYLDKRATLLPSNMNSIDDTKWLFYFIRLKWGMPRKQNFMIWAIFIQIFCGINQLCTIKLYSFVLYLLDRRNNAKQIY